MLETVKPIVEILLVVTGSWVILVFAVGYILGTKKGKRRTSDIIHAVLALAMLAASLACIVAGLMVDRVWLIAGVALMILFAIMVVFLARNPVNTGEGEAPRKICETFKEE